MQKLAIALGVTLAAISTAGYAAPQEGTFYTGAKVGWSSYYSTGLDVTGVANKASDTNQVGAGAFVGYQIASYVGLELGYDWFGRMSYKKGPTPDSLSAAYKAQGIQFGVKLTYPIRHNLDIYTRLGLGGVAWRAESTIDGDRQKASGISPMIALGTEYAITDSVAARLDYQWTDKIGKNDKLHTRPSNGMLALGISYRFGQQPQVRRQPPAPAAIIQAPVEPVPVIAEVQQKFILNTEILFEFGKSSLTAEGKMILDQMINQLKSKDIVDGAVTVLGYADRIGSEKYNLILSEKRSVTVVNYLLAKGISADKITSRGMGQSNSAASTTCDDVITHKTLITCLASDRRVEVEVEGLSAEQIAVEAGADEIVDEVVKTVQE